MAWARSALAVARRSDDSVDHFAAAQPEYAANTATNASRAASKTEIVLLRLSSRSASTYSACSASPLPASTGERPSGTSGARGRTPPTAAPTSYPAFDAAQMSPPVTGETLTGPLTAWPALPWRRAGRSEQAGPSGHNKAILSQLAS